MKQLDLLEWTRPASIIPFPTSKRIGKIRQTAIVVRQKRGSKKALEAYWTQTTDNIARQMLRSGIPPDIVCGELIDFENSVAAEVRRLDVLDGYSAPRA
ncbi:MULTISPECIES: DUF6074 family protein [unclassified Agrobacterium]|uniref:DUF6074 family protein n=1 Tax=unclassified Agrobacterium TaxID=2632611 RepID=UPI0024468F8F|nr:MULTISPECIES: DUF6074 family protein [unclassified Agrobacterium]MDH0613426.1 DUF6074 family protein [Agrobacterium sp. GD03872]MDH0697343.1 DUF6074 family protein [Agrobacterium sp. GD03871]MDH1060866.1 DUF6074 family protein [Agrobacterium sp. GD03992]MDH2211450.1 DUF6074 family protein [Agrobacterium sp. GD03643]MDH2220709.1 DUF6074 family protein [Agrobacterium sp. GD03638]